MRYMKHLLALSILAALLFSSCSIQKRTYRPGYYITWNHSSPPVQRKTETEIKQTEQEQTPAPEIDPTITASAEPEPLILPREPIVLSTADSCGDLLRKRNGDMIRVKVLEILPTEIKYKRCDNLSGPLYTESKKNIARIDFSNGLTETFAVEDLPKETPAVVYTPPKKREPKPDMDKELATKYLAIGAGALLFTFGMIAGLVLAVTFDELFVILGVTCALIGLIAGIVDLAMGTRDYKDQRRFGERGPNFKMASAGLHFSLFSIILCAIGLIASLVMILIFFGL